MARRRRTGHARVRAHSCGARPGYGPPSRRPSSRCQTARSAASAAQHISFPRRIVCARVVASCSLSPPHLRCICRRFGGLVPKNPWRQLQLRPRNGGPAERREASLPQSRSVATPLRRDLTLPRGRRLSALHRGVSARAPLRLRHSSGAGARLLAAGHCSWRATAPGFRHRGYEPRSTPLPAPPTGSSPETPLMSEDGKPYTIYSLRSQ